MREHGVLDRLLLIYEAGLKKFDSNEDFDPAVITGAAQIVRDFIENYHEQSEEQAVFRASRKRERWCRFITMYRPHAAREDTDLFPLLKGIVSPHEYDAMAEDVERKEHKLFGGDGFDMMARRVAGLEQSIGISDLAQFTPR
jgi:hemerythrin-like domain-containing protein